MASDSLSEFCFKTDIRNIIATLRFMSTSEFEYCRMFHKEIEGLLSHACLMDFYIHESLKSLAK